LTVNGVEPQEVNDATTNPAPKASVTNKTPVKMAIMALNTDLRFSFDKLRMPF